MTFRCAGVVPPTITFVLKSVMRTPTPPFPAGAAPSAVVPM
jgi:hypothetical protein